MKFRTLTIAILGAFCGAAFANYEDGMSMGYTDNSLLCAVIDAGGGPMRFDTHKALKHALGSSKYDSEVAKLNNQFGEGKVYRALAVNDYVMCEGLRAMSVLHCAYYDPEPYGTDTARDWIRSGVDSNGTFTTERQLDRILGYGTHKDIMMRVDDRFGDGASADYHQIMDQMTADLAPNVGMTIHITESQ